MAEVKFEIIEHIGTLANKNSGWAKELNIVKWGDREPKYDIRDWNEDHTHCGRGMTFTEQEMLYIVDLVQAKQIPEVESEVTPC